MCGIAGIVIKQKTAVDLVKTITGLSATISHRGPDGEGFMIAGEHSATPCFNTHHQYQRHDLNYIPKSSIQQAAESGNASLAFAHRRLAIIDLSDSGHQPMCTPDEKLWITFNGEIYNYIELREELKNLGHQFISESDTEVILKAYEAWGTACVRHFNGMWSFCLYDRHKQICFASRDRLGVKPFYYVNNPQAFAFASEQKALVKNGLASARINQKALHYYMVNTLLENDTQNFFEDITELWPGSNLVYDLKSGQIKTEAYYHLSDHITLNNNQLSDKELIDKVAHTFENAVKLRLRSDVEVGTCLSGGIDSSALAVTISGITKQPLFCFTSVFRNQVFNEEHYADLVAKKVNAKYFKVEPDLDGFLREADQLIYSQDVPIWDTSTYAQYKVMELARQNNIKVVLDGQGADELFGGYHHHFVAKWNNLFAAGRVASGLRDIAASKKTIPNPFLFYTKERLKQHKNFNQKHLDFLFTGEFLSSHDIKRPLVYQDSVNSQLLNDIYETRLKTFLKCEDRCGMWHGVESRTPFSDDIELINLLFSIDGNRKIKNGVSKYLLREAVKDKLPQEIYSRYDKKGFETPMQQWMQRLRPELMLSIKEANFDFVNQNNLEKTDPGNVFHNKLLFKLFVLSRWKKLFA